MGPECDAYKQIEVIVSDSFLSQEYEMPSLLKLHNSEYMLHITINPMLHNDKHIANSSHFWCIDKQ